MKKEKLSKVFFGKWKNIVLFLVKNKNMNNSIPDNNRTRAQFNAYIGTYLSFGGYLESYSNAFEVLIKEVHKTGFHVDHLAYPYSIYSKTLFGIRVQK